MCTDIEWVHEELGKVVKKVIAEGKRINGGIPYIAIDGIYDDKLNDDISWWTNGFWGGLNWQLYHYSEEENLKEVAIKSEKELDLALFDFIHLHHDVGFMWMPTSKVNYLLNRSDQSYKRTLHAAAILASRYNVNGKFLRAWNSEQTAEDNSGWVIIDSMMNIPLLFWASRELDDPRYELIAEAHANTLAHHLVRTDGSVNHIGIFDSVTGEFSHHLAGQGYADNSAWTRGQGWALFGFARCYHYTKNELYLETAKKVAHFTMSQLALTNFLPRIDFKAPSVEYDNDASAAAIMACGLLEIEKHVPKQEKKFYRTYAISILKRLSQFANYNEDVDGIIGKCAVQYHGKSSKNSSLIYADYFYVEGLLRLINQDIEVW